MIYLEINIKGNIEKELEKAKVSLKQMMINFMKVDGAIIKCMEEEEKLSQMASAL